MEFIQGFDWAVPTGFNDAIAQCKFDLGDSLYNTIKAYEQWSTALKHLKYGIVVKSSASLPSSAKSSFNNNWSSPLELELTYYKEKNKKEIIKSTQGRLFTCIWHGDINILKPDTNEPSVPIVLRHVTKRLDEVEIVLREKIGIGNTFAMAYDPTSNIATEKRQKISDSLKEIGSVSINQYSPFDLGMSDATIIHPSISILCFTSDGNSKEIKESLKTALYTGHSNSKSKSFRIRNHGIYFEETQGRSKYKTEHKLF